MSGALDDPAFAHATGIGLATGHVLLITTSPDGEDFTALTRPPWAPPKQIMMRDHTLMHYDDGSGHPYFLCAFTEEKETPGGLAFGLARSPDLKNWESLPDVVPRCGEKTLHVWSPYLFQDPATKKVHVFITLCTPSGWQGIGFITCTNPGTWTQWTDWKLFEPLRQDHGMFNGGAIYALHGKYYFFYDDASRRTGYAAAEAYRVSSTNAFSGYGPPVYIPSLNSTLSIDDAFNKKPPKQYRYEGMSLVWVGGTVWRIYDQEFGALNGVLVDDVMGFVQSDDNMATWGTFRFLGDEHSNVGNFIASHVYRLDYLMGK